MDCITVSDKLTALLDGELPGEEARALREHLGGCERCAAELDELAALERPLQRLGAMPVPEGFAGRVRAAAESRPAEIVRARFGNWMTRLAACLVAATGLVTGLSLGQATVRSAATRSILASYTAGMELPTEGLSAIPPGSIAEAYLSFMEDDGEGER